MTDNPPGRLYRSAGAQHPDAIPALLQPTSPQRELPDELPPAPRQRRSLSAPRIYLLVGLGTAGFGLADRLITGELGLITSIGFLVLSVSGALLAEPLAGWAAWTAPPIAFGFLALVYANIGPNAAEGFLMRQVLGTVLALAAHAWPVGITTVACWVIVRRAQVEHGIRPRRRSPEADEF